MNTITILFGADYAVKHPENPQHGALLIAECIFTSFYVLELIAKLMVFRAHFLFGFDWAWNMLDLTCVFLSVLDMMGSLLNPNSGSHGGSVLRLIRLLRLSRMFRTF